MGETIDKVKAFVEVRRIPGGDHHPIEQMRRWKWLVAQEVVNQLDGISLVVPVMWKRNSMENWWAGHPEDDAKDGMDMESQAYSHYQYKWQDGVADAMDYLGIRVAVMAVTEHGGALAIRGAGEEHVRHVMSFVMVHSGMGERCVFHYRIENEGSYVLIFMDKDDAPDSDGWKRFTLDEAKKVEKEMEN